MRITPLHTMFAATLVTSSVVSSAILSAQKPAKPKAPQVISLSGCIERDEKTPDQFTITDPKAGGTYRVSGKDFREFLGRRVQLDGGVVVKGFAIKGGLQPNPNVAAQAGAIDPSRAAVQSATSGSGTGAEPTNPEFRVKAIHPAGGDCGTKN